MLTWHAVYNHPRIAHRGITSDARISLGGCITPHMNLTISGSKVWLSEFDKY